MYVHFFCTFKISQSVGKVHISKPAFDYTKYAGEHKATEEGEVVEDPYGWCVCMFFMFTIYLPVVRRLSEHVGVEWFPAWLSEWGFPYDFQGLYVSVSKCKWRTYGYVRTYIVMVGFCGSSIKSLYELINTHRKTGFTVTWVDDSHALGIFNCAFAGMWSSLPLERSVFYLWHEREIGTRICQNEKWRRKYQNQTDVFSFDPFFVIHQSLLVLTNSGFYILVFWQNWRRSFDLTHMHAHSWASSRDDGFASICESEGNVCRVHKVPGEGQQPWSRLTVTDATTTRHQ